MIRAAIDSGRPPLELILDQPNRKRCKWDGMLIKALYLLESYEVEGYPIWVEESPDITFSAKRREIRSAAVIESLQDKDSKSKSKKKGLRYYAEANLKPGAKWPTRKDWEERRANRANNAESSADATRVAEAEQRAKEKVQNDPELQRIVAEFERKFKSNDTAGKIEGVDLTA